MGFVRICLAVGLFLAAWNDADAMSDTNSSGIAFEDVTVLPMDREQVMEHHTVLVRGDRIEAVGPTRTTKIPAEYRRIDGRGKFLMPGLADFHVHLRSPGEFPTYLAYGVTTVAHLSGAYPGAPNILHYRNMIASGQLVGPTIYASGPLVDNAPLLPHTRNIGIGISTQDEARKVAAIQKAAGYDMLKIYQLLNPEVYDALVTAAREQRIAPVGHVPQTITLTRALDAGQVMIAHGLFVLEPMINKDFTSYDLSRLKSIARSVAEKNVAVQPTIAMDLARRRLENGEHNEILRDPEIRFLAPDLYRAWSDPDLSYLRYSIRSSLSIPNLLKLIKALQDAGALILLGTDEGALPGVFPGISVHQELGLFVQAGLTPFQALQTATKNTGEFVTKRINADDRFGTVTVGSRADLLLLQYNPLENVGHASKPLGVMVRGRWLSLSDLRSMRDSAVKVFRLGPPADVTAN
jgi:hypothetical protein